MPVLHVRLCNSGFETRDDGATYAGAEDALAVGIESATLIVAEEINGGRPTAAVDVVVEDREGEPLLRSVVTLSASPLATAKRRDHRDSA